MGQQAPPGLVGIHSNMRAWFPPEIDKMAFVNAPAPSDLSAEENTRTIDSRFSNTHGLGYARRWATGRRSRNSIHHRSGGVDNDHDIWSYKMIARVFDGKSEGSRETISSTTSRSTGSRTRQSRPPVLYGKTSWRFSLRKTFLSCGGECFPGRHRCPGEKWAEKAYPKLIQFNRLDKGGHFGAWEQPELFVNEMRAAFRSLR